MDFEALIRKHVGEDGNIPADNIGKVASAIASAVGRDFVDKKRYDQKLAEIDELTAAKNAAEDKATAAEQWKTKFEASEQAMKDYKAEVAGKETLAAKKAAYRKLLDAEKINSADADLIIAATKFDDLALGDDGKLADADNLTESIKTNYARYIPTTHSKGDNPATPPHNGGDNGANPRAAEIARQFHERRYGAAPAKDGANNNDK